MNYRREIDGLRAFAVIPVILFHAGFPAFSGGFVGVDVFFVISGYLITSVILVDKQNGTFSLSGFYERRARRILPALFVVMTACLPFAWLWMFPGDRMLFSQSLMTVPVFGSNILFYLKSGYFDTASELIPLLHTWSLAVEEQYYLIFPLFILLTWRLSKRWILGLLVVVALVSLLVAQWGSLTHPSFAFFLLPTRGWEILTGAFTAFYLLPGKVRENSDGLVAQSGSLVGILLVIYAVFCFDRQTPFPGVYALIPTVGTALVILFATPKTVVGRLLGSRLFVGVGLISYSAYLWHQPLFAFARLRSFDSPDDAVLLGLAVAALLLAYFSWKYVEVPFRDKRRTSRKMVVSCALIFTIAFCGLGLWGYLRHGFEKTFVHGLSEEQRQIYSYGQYPHSEVYRESRCFLQTGQTYADFSPECQAPKSDAPSFLIWGDSHAAALSKGLRSVHPSVIQFTASACPPIVDIALAARPNCLAINDFVKREIARLKPGEIFLDADWMQYRRQDLATNIGKTIDYIRRVSPASNITIVGIVPQWQPTLPMVMLRRHLSLDKEQYLRTPAYGQLAALDDNLSSVAQGNQVNFFSALQNLCIKDECKVVTKSANGFTLTAWDYGHLTEGGSILLAQKMIAQLPSCKSDERRCIESK